VSHFGVCEYKYRPYLCLPLIPCLQCQSVFEKTLLFAYPQNLALFLKSSVVCNTLSFEKRPDVASTAYGIKYAKNLVVTRVYKNFTVQLSFPIGWSISPSITVCFRLHRVPCTRVPIVDFWRVFGHRDREILTRLPRLKDLLLSALFGRDATVWARSGQTPITALPRRGLWEGEIHAFGPVEKRPCGLFGWGDFGVRSSFLRIKLACRQETQHSKNTCSIPGLNASGTGIGAHDRERGEREILALVNYLCFRGHDCASYLSCSRPAIGYRICLHFLRVISFWSPSSSFFSRRLLLVISGRW